MNIEGYKKHKKLIEKWANGAEIEYYSEIQKKWDDLSEQVGWYAKYEYRIKPQVKTVDAWFCQYKGATKGGFVVMHKPTAIKGYRTVKKISFIYTEGEIDE